MRIGWVERAPTTDELWLITLQEVCARAAHEWRSSLNGVSVNLEVVRARSTRASLPVSAVQPFADAAADQLEAVIAMTEAALILSRSAREPVELVPLLRLFVALLAPAAKASGGSLSMGAVTDETTATSAPATAVRMVLGSALLAAFSGTRAVACHVTAAEHLDLHIEASSDNQEPVAVERQVVDAAADAGIRMRTERSGISIAFPRVITAGSTGAATSPQESTKP